MKNIFRIIRTTIVGGIFFLLPLAFIIIISGKIWGFTQRVVRPLLGGSQNTTIIGIALYEVVAICLLLLVCLLAGLLAARSKATANDRYGDEPYWFQVHR